MLAQVTSQSVNAFRSLRSCTQWPPLLAIARIRGLRAPFAGIGGGPSAATGSRANRRRAFDSASFACGSIRAPPRQLMRPIEQRSDLVLVPRHEDAGALGEPLRRRELVVIPRLAEARCARDDDDRLAPRQALDDGARAGVGDDHGGFVELARDLLEGKRGCRRKPLHHCAADPVLEEEILTAATARPFGDRERHAVERKLGSDGHEDHTTAPAK